MKNDIENTQAGSDCQKRLVSGSFTPGPWRYNGKTDVYDSTGATVCELYKGYETRSDKGADAILIAAAPDMLAALERIVNKFDAGRNVEGHCICDARAAIELAHGNFSYANDERMHPYQRGRASITGFGLWLRKIIETGRLVGVVMARLVLQFIFFGCSNMRPPHLLNHNIYFQA